MSSFLVSQPLPTLGDLQREIAALQDQLTRLGGSNPVGLGNAIRSQLAQKQSILNALLHPDQVPGIPPAPNAPPTLAPRPVGPRVGFSDLVIAPHIETAKIPSPVTAANGGLIPLRGY